MTASSRGGIAKRVLCIFGTRPEAIKMAPVVLGLRNTSDLQPIVAVTGQHRSMLDQVLETFAIEPEHDLGIARERQTLGDITRRALEGLEVLIAEVQPDLVVLQGDTTTAFAAALAGFYARVPVVHVEAGLRTGDPMSPYPEEVNRRLISQLAALHLAPTPSAAAHLGSEGVKPHTVVCTGNTVIDALNWTITRPQSPVSTVLRGLDGDERRLILVTVHRRESWGGPITGVGRALAAVARANPDVLILVPIHKNPIVRESLLPVLSGIGNVRLIEPLPYHEFAHVMLRSHLVVTDSGGIQEEAPSLGKPVLVLREVTERPEAVASGSVELVGTGETHVTERIQGLLSDPVRYARMAQARSPYGDGRAAERSVAAMRWLLGAGPRPEEFRPDATMFEVDAAERVA
ncbi:MAG: UDP-N-acetylglucosamine 2-epimerase (non-hydrolyzing) [Actinomycetota bacterium]|nr:UDP-N-acetylglucosamine 2-epimerase (non-hydrolyzing) [Actinomycetota bacterium]